MASSSTITKENAVTIAEHEREWDEIFSGIHDVIDACAFQDGHIDYDELDAFFEVNKKLAESVTDELVKYLTTQQWDGKLPAYFVTSDGTVLPILGSMTGDSESNTEVQ